MKCDICGQYYHQKCSDMNSNFSTITCSTSKPQAGSVCFAKRLHVLVLHVFKQHQSHSWRTRWQFWSVSSPAWKVNSPTSACRKMAKTLESNNCRLSWPLQNLLVMQWEILYRQQQTNSSKTPWYIQAKIEHIIVSGKPENDDNRFDNFKSTFLRIREENLSVKPAVTESDLIWLGEI